MIGFGIGARRAARQQRPVVEIAGVGIEAALAAGTVAAAHTTAIGGVDAAAVAEAVDPHMPTEPQVTRWETQFFF